MPRPPKPILFSKMQRIFGYGNRRVNFPHNQGNAGAGRKAGVVGTIADNIIFWIYHEANN